MDCYWPSAKILLSSNCNLRPEGEEVSLLVLHNISLPPGEFGGGYIESFFLNTLNCSFHPYFEQLQTLKVSAHCLIARSGDVTQFVSFDMRAWHAGNSIFCGRSNCNDYSIGIELEGTDDQPYTDEQYNRLVELSEFILAKYPKITTERIVGHSDIAPGRKTDPGPAFDWARYKNTLNKER